MADDIPNLFFTAACYVGLWYGSPNHNTDPRISCLGVKNMVRGSVLPFWLQRICVVVSASSLPQVALVMGASFWIRGVVLVLFSIIGASSFIILQLQSDQPRGSTRIVEPINAILKPNQDVNTIQAPRAPQPVPTFTPTYTPTATFTPTATSTITPHPTAITTIPSTATSTVTPVVVVELQSTSTPLPSSNTNDPTAVCNNLANQEDKEDCWWRWHNDLPLIEQPTPTPVLQSIPTPTLALLPSPTPVTQPEFLDVKPSRITYKIRPDSDILREVFSDNRFQSALHHSINCDEINHAVYHGRANLNQICRVNEYNLDIGHDLLDEIGLHWDTQGIYRMRPDDRKFSWTIESINNNQQTNDILKLCKKYFETIGLDMSIKQINKPSTIKEYTISTTVIGSGTCIDWLSLFAQSPKAPCTTQEEKHYLLAPGAGGISAYVKSHLLAIFEYDWNEIVEGTHYITDSDKYFHEPMSEFIQGVKQFEPLVPPERLQHIHSIRESIAKLELAVHDLIYRALDELNYSHIDTVKLHIETLENLYNEEYNLINQTCDIDVPYLDLPGEESFFESLD